MMTLRAKTIGFVNAMHSVGIAFAVATVFALGVSSAGAQQLDPPIDARVKRERGRRRVAEARRGDRFGDRYADRRVPPDQQEDRVSQIFNRSAPPGHRLAERRAREPAVPDRRRRRGGPLGHAADAEDDRGARPVRRARRPVPPRGTQEPRERPSRADAPVRRRRARALPADPRGLSDRERLRPHDRRRARVPSRRTASTIPVDFLRVGRVGLLYKTRDAEEYGVWNQADKVWQVLDKSDYANWIDEGLRVAKKQSAPQLIRVPLPQPKSGGKS